MSEKFIPVITRYFSMKIKVDDIFRIEQESRKLVIRTEDHYYSYYQKPADIKHLLGNQFYWCMKHMVINLDKVDEISDGVVYFVNGDELPLSRECYAKVKQTYNAFIKKILNCDIKK